jgi:hypothetical protein
MHLTFPQPCSSIDVQGVSPATASSIDVQGVWSLSTVGSMDVQGVPACPASGQTGTGMNKNADAGTILVPEQGDSIRYRHAPVSD